ncbi:helicase [Mangrovimicrobium sediminis]|uniref:Helicase n=1 Tax=Mangrovimicrobium sediminis TaxID=2562682 RepID=A0A4Z0LY45_9GAMM|nr:DEAD/DEAH box helicase family protein [Haliea sp. SAOS-164]TGD72201.1 helicase [Haliea sp. SAOS-164]
MSARPLDLATAGEILDFTGGDESLASLGQLQLEGAVALHNMIVDPEVRMGYLADEVGMGKTYVALGVVALLRYFNPTLRVLYICPSNNVQEKWYNREYRAFAKDNVRVSHYRVRTLDGRSAAPSISCRNVPELLHSLSRGHYNDIFVGMSSFSLSLNEDESYWEAKLEELRELLPAARMAKYRRSKDSVKEVYAEALNYVLPTFDLVVIDEAHNFKHDFESSDRNKVLSAALGFRGNARYRRVKSALLLSATPYDRNIEQLRNQLKLVGDEHLLPAEVTNDDPLQIENHLRRFMVRRLNELQIAGQPHTRNMYRMERRSGDGAQIELASDEQKLVTALVQKKVGEALVKQGGSPSFQMGLLASFESYAETAKSGPVEFDGISVEKEHTDAADRHVVAVIQDSYVDAKLGRTLPHPKMDIVCQRLAEQLFTQNRKQIVFVRRVKSVKELKIKLDDHYSDWLTGTIRDSLKGYPAQREIMENLVAEFERQSTQREDDISGGDFKGGSTGEAEDQQPPKNDTLFTWFFRGACPTEAEPYLKQGDDSYTTPEAMRAGLSAKNQVISALLEINWARVVTRLRGDALAQLLVAHADTIAKLATTYTKGQLRNNQLELFEASQLGFLHWYAEQHDLPELMLLVNHLASREQVKEPVKISPDRLEDALNTHTLYCALHDADLLHSLFPALEPLLGQLLEGTAAQAEALQKLEIHKHLVSLCLRTGHGVIDLYLARLKLGTANLTATTRAKWMDSFAKALREQSNKSSFSTYRELYDTAQHLDLIIKNNLPEIYDKDREEYRIHLSRALNPIAPVIGATGETVALRTAQARKFRMPGYPLALISTDVFQEGEDLHTFCDSVVHYGLSGSPVSIEQKTGRVDRVGAKAQRRLRGMKDAQSVSDEDLIQVSFPFVKESIEFLQVRALCRNLNTFIESLHKIGERLAPMSDIIEAEREMIDASPIPDQIRNHLTSPYLAICTQKSSRLNREVDIRNQGSHMERVRQHLEALLKEYFGESAIGNEGLYLSYPDGPTRNVRVNLRSARSSGELLISAEVIDETITLDEISTLAKLKEQMVIRSWNTFHRTYAAETSLGHFQLHHDAEMLVGDDQLTSAGEIARFFERFARPHNPADYAMPTSKTVTDAWRQANKEGNSHYGQWRASVTTYKPNGCLGLEFRFGEDSWSRTHCINIFEAEGRCIFLAQAASAEVVRCLSVEQLVRLTWERNRYNDIVEFALDDEYSLMGRAIHPVEGLSYREFMYCAYTLAVLTDRLEFLVRQEDVH